MLRSLPTRLMGCRVASDLGVRADTPCWDFVQALAGARLARSAETLTGSAVGGGCSLTRIHRTIGCLGLSG